MRGEIGTEIETGSARRGEGRGEGAPAVSVIVPAYDEEESIGPSVEAIRQALDGAGVVHELVVVDDGSEDRTGERARAAGARVLTLPENRGYGSAIKFGIARTRHPKIVICDADRTYPAHAIPELLAFVDVYDMVVGARVVSNDAVPWARRPAKWLLRKLASYLSGRPIPDINSGLRVMDRAMVERFVHLLPSGFSLTTTITLAALCSDYLVHYHPIRYYPRVGRSKIRPFHAAEFLLLVLRTMVYFNPLKIFLPLGAVFFLVGAGKFAYDLTRGNLSELALMGFLGSALLWSVGLLADQISRLGLAPRGVSASASEGGGSFVRSGRQEEE